jgi:hypothetical protein
MIQYLVGLLLIVALLWIWSAFTASPATKRQGDKPAPLVGPQSSAARK